MFGKVPESLASDKKFINLSLEAKYIYVYLLFNKHRKLLGVYYLPVGYVEIDTGIKSDKIDKALDELVSIGYIGYDKENEIVLIINYLEINSHYNPNHIKGGLREIQRLNLSNLIDLFTPIKEVIEKVIDIEEKETIKNELNNILQSILNKNNGHRDEHPNGHRDAMSMPISISISNSISNSKEGGVGGEKKSDLELVKEIHQKLCDESGKNFKLTDAVKTSIRARLNDGFTKEEIFEAIEKQVANCKENNVPQYMHPSTVFRNTTSIERALSYQPKKQNNGKIVIADDDPLNFL